MSLKERLERAERRLAEIEALLQTAIARVQEELRACREMLAEPPAVGTGPEAHGAPAAPQATEESAPETVDISTIRKAMAWQKKPESSEEPLQKEGDERRTSPRRKGNPISVDITAANVREEPFQGWVVDRSSGGVRLLVDSKIAAGSLLNVRPTKASGTWVQVKVSYCRAERGSWLLGCKFSHKLSWAEMQQFG